MHVFIQQLFANYLFNNWGFSGCATGKEPPHQCKRHKRLRFYPWIGKIPWKKAWQLTPVFLPENPMDSGSWQATVHRVTKSWT